MHSNYHKDHFRSSAEQQDIDLEVEEALEQEQPRWYSIPWLAAGTVTVAVGTVAVERSTQVLEALHMPQAQEEERSIALAVVHTPQEQQEQQEEVRSKQQDDVGWEEEVEVDTVQPH